MLEYLRNHQYIDEDLPIMVRDMPPSETGMPVELYCFSRINQWVPYEAVQSGIFDYIFAVVTQFGLRVFQNPAGSDIESLKK
jgi:miniconductance mechanosensitive channel